LDEGLCKLLLSIAKARRFVVFRGLLALRVAYCVVIVGGPEDVIMRCLVKDR
jgi:hypothetical protein